jgi:hypothetical protein
VRLPTHRSEHTGNAGADRVQDNVRDLIGKVNNLLLGIARTHGVGLKRVPLRDADYHLTSGDMEGAFVVFTGLLTATREVFVPRATDANSYGRWFYNFTGQTLTFRNADGSANVGSNSVRLIVVSADGPEPWT